MREHHRVEPLAQLTARDVDADVDTGAEDRALAAHLVESRSICRFSILNSGMPKRSSPPISSARS